MSEQNHHIYEFGPFRLDADRRLLLREGEPVKLFPKEFETLLALVERSGEELNKDELMHRVWGDTVVEESNLAKNVSALRRILGESPTQHQYIVTLPGQGYRFVASVRAPTFDEVLVHERTRAEITIEEDSGGVAEKPTVYARHEPALLTGSPSFRFTRLTLAIGGALALLLIGGTIFTVSRYLGRRDVVAAPAFQQTDIRRLTINGDPRAAALARDGKLFAYVLNDSEMKRSLWLGHVDGGEPRELRPAAEVFYPALTFAPDGSSLYFTTSDDVSSSSGTLYRVPVFGGVPEKIKDNVRNRITFSPDGKQFAFVRRGPNRTTILVITDATTSMERELASRSDELGFSQQSPAWSPDGSTIAVAASTSETSQHMEIFLVSVSNGSIQRLTNTEWTEVSMISWLKDGKGMITVAAEKRSDSQLWHVFFPGGATQRIATDLNSYSYAANLSADGRSLLAVRTQRQSNIWLGQADDLASAKQITFDMLGRVNGWNGLDWTPDGRLVFTAAAGEGHTLWSARADGSDKKQILPAGYMNVHPVVTSDGRYVVFESDRSGDIEIWRADIESGELRQLTNGGRNSQPHVTPDGKSVVYRARHGDSYALWRVSIDGGSPVRLTEYLASWPRVSPDGNLIACSYGSKLAVLSIAGGPPLKQFELPRLANFNNGIRWTLDGKSVTYRDWANGVWQQRLDHSKPERIENLPNEKLYSYGWSRDGKQFAFTRGTELRDLVLIRDVR